MDLGALAEIGLLLGVATVVSLIMRFLRQPLIIGHIITGFLVGRYAVGLFENTETLELFSQLGIAFLLFSVGLNLNPNVLKKYGLASVFNTFGQFFITGGAGVILCLLIGFDWTTSLYVGIAISFSSTVIVLKILADKGDLDKLYVKISMGSLLLQDLVAIILLFAIPVLSDSSGFSGELLKTLALGVAATVGVFLVANTVIKRLHTYLTRSQELLFLFANAWGIGIAMLFHEVGFSLEGGALIAGVALASLPSSREMMARLTPLRDFFIVTFFILLGSRMVVSDFGEIAKPAIILSIFVLIVNPLIQLIIMGVLGYRKKTSFQTGVIAAQISEFSLILVGMGVTLGQVEPSVLSAVTMVGIITIFISTYLIYYSDSLYKYCAPFLGIFERKNAREHSVRSEKYPIILIGGGRLSYDFLKLFQKQGQRFLVIDHDPDIIARLDADGIEHEYGDASDPDLLHDLKIADAKMVISTVPDLETNYIVISTARKAHSKTTVIVTSHATDDALGLYEAGADYVILPHFLGGKHASLLVNRYSKGTIKFEELKGKHIAQLEDRALHGHEHPVHDKHH